MVIIIVCIRHGEEGCFASVDSFTPEFEVPIDECAVVLIYHGVFDNNCPGSNSRLAPEERKYV